MSSIHGAPAGARPACADRVARELVASASQQASTDPLIGAPCSTCWCRWRSSPIWPARKMVEVDAETAVIPRNCQVNRRCQRGCAAWSVRCRLWQAAHRALSRTVVDATPEDAVLVIGEPRALAGARPGRGPRPGRIASSAPSWRRSRSALVDHNDAQHHQRPVRALLAHRTWPGAAHPTGRRRRSRATRSAPRKSRRCARCRTRLPNCCHLAGRDVKTFGGNQDRQHSPPTWPRS